jgi:hypothetical protein
LPTPALDRAMLALRDLPQSERDHWREVFHYYVFKADERVTAPIPERKRGFVDPVTEKSAKAIRARLNEYFQR